MNIHCYFSELLGKTLKSVTVGAGNDGEEIRFVCEDGSIYIQYHSQDCCESVYIDDIEGDLNDLVGSPILVADESTNRDNPKHYSEDPRCSYNEESCTWTFYKLATVKGYVTIRWYGSSNGCYSESVDFKQIA